MGRVIGSVVLGYVAMVVTVFVLMTAAWFAFGADGALQPGTFDPSLAWIVVFCIVGIAAAVDGGFVTAVVSRSDQRALWGLIGLVVVLGVVSALPYLGQADTASAARGATVTMAEAMKNARTPSWVALLNPVIGVVGAWIGFRIRRAPAAAPAQAA